MTHHGGHHFLKRDVVFIEHLALSLEDHECDDEEEVIANFLLFLQGGLSFLLQQGEFEPSCATKVGAFDLHRDLALSQRIELGMIRIALGRGCAITALHRSGMVKAYQITTKRVNREPLAFSGPDEAAYARQRNSLNGAHSAQRSLIMRGARSALEIVNETKASAQARYSRVSDI